MREVKGISGRAVLYIVGQFPSASEKFIQHEIESLTNAGLRIVILSLQRGRQAKGDTGYLPVSLFYARPFYRLAAAHGRLLLGKPGIYMHTWFKEVGNMLSFSFRGVLGKLKAFSVAVDLIHQTRKIDLYHIHAHFLFQPAAVARIISAITGIPYSASAHARDIYVNDKEKIRSFFETSSFIITCTRYNSRWLDRITEGRHKDKILHIYHGLDGSRWRQKSNTEISGEHIKVIAVARFVEKKGLLFLLKAIILLKNMGYSISCTLAGDGPLRQELECFVIRHGLEDVVGMPGEIEQKQAEALYLGSDIMVMPSIIAPDGDRDGLPNVLLETLWVGLPVISTSVSAIGELIEDGITGLITPPGDETAIAQAIIRLYNDSWLRDTLVRNGREKIRREFAIEDSTALLLSVFTRPAQYNNGPKN